MVAFLFFLLLFMKSIRFLDYFYIFYAIRNKSICWEIFSNITNIITSTVKKDRFFSQRIHAVTLEHFYNSSKNIEESIRVRTCLLFRVLLPFMWDLLCRKYYTTQTSLTILIPALTSTKIYSFSAPSVSVASQKPKTVFMIRHSWIFF